MLNIVADLQRVLAARTMTERMTILSSCIKQYEGELDEASVTLFKQIFDKYYTPDDIEYKYAPDVILRVYIASHPTPEYAHTKCFQLDISDGTRDVATYKRLAGSNRTKAQNLQRAMRHAIDDQILEYRRTHPLNPEELCPIEGIPLGETAQVDHVPPFHVLAKQWLQTSPHVKCHVSKTDRSVYELDEPYKSSWQDYHRRHATLRYLSVEGNKRAHHHYIAGK